VDNSVELKQYFKYRLFVSVDIAGSTGFKQKFSKWVKVFDQFFNDFPPLLQAYLDELPDHVRGKPAHAMRVWKYVGDEILFYTTIHTHEECLYHAHSVKQSIKEYEDQFWKQHPISLKCSMWSAGFPVRNSAVKLAYGDRIVTDFLGPDIDLGFRIGQFADSRRIPVNAELAHLLRFASTTARSEHTRGILPILLYEQSVSLKGVLGGTPYPIIWIDRFDGKQTPEDKLLGVTRGGNTEAMADFLDRFIDRHYPHIVKPFIVTDTDPTLSSIPSKLIEDLRQQLAENPDYLYEQATTDEALKSGNESGIKSEPPAIPD